MKNSVENSRDPWSKFYWADWRSDPLLRACGLAARGLWVEMLGVMHEAVPCGHLLINGRVPTDSQLAVMVGAPLSEVRKLKKELEDAGVPGITAEGVWFSRRMVRDAKRRAVNRANGAGGGNPKLTDKPSVDTSDNRMGYSNGISEPDNPSDKSRARTCARVPEARSQKPDSSTAISSSPPSTPAALLSEKAVQVSQRLKTILGTDENRHPAWARLDHIAAWLTAGADPELDIYPAAAAANARGKGPPRSPAYLAEAVMDAVRTRTTPGENGARHDAMNGNGHAPPNPEREAAARKFNRDLDAWIAAGREGPMPELALPAGT